MSKDPYSGLAGSYDAVVGRLNDGLRRLGAKMVPPREGMAVLDIGCGTGAHLALYRQAGCTVAGVDTSPSMLDIARERLGDEADLRLADATALPFSEGTFDLAIAMTVLHEMPQHVRLSTLSEMARVLTADGRILIIDFNPGPVRPIKGWLTKGLILVSELIAGPDHFLAFRDYWLRRGVPPLAEAAGLSIEQEKIVSGGAFGLHVLRRS